MNEPERSVPQRARKPKELLLGIGIALLAPFPVLFLISLILINSEAALLPVLFIGVFQWVYLVPLLIYFRKKGKTSLIQGLLIGGGVVFLLNAGCYGLVFLSFKDGFH